MKSLGTVNENEDKQGKTTKFIVTWSFIQRELLLFIKITYTIHLLDFKSFAGITLRNLELLNISGKLSAANICFGE